MNDQRQRGRWIILRALASDIRTKSLGRRKAGSDLAASIALVASCGSSRCLVTSLPAEGADEPYFTVEDGIKLWLEREATIDHLYTSASLLLTK